MNELQEIKEKLSSIEFILGTLLEKPKDNDIVILLQTISAQLSQLSTLYNLEQAIRSLQFAIERMPQVSYPVHIGSLGGHHGPTLPFIVSSGG